MTETLIDIPDNPSIVGTSILGGHKMEYIRLDDELKNNLWKKIAPISSMFNEHNINFEQVKALVKEFFTELLQKNQKLVNVSKSELLAYFILGAKKLLDFKPEHISVELTTAKSIYFFAKVGRNNIYYEIFFDEDSGRFATTSVNIYENKVQKLAISGSYQIVSYEMDENLANNGADNYLTYIFVSKEVSGSTNHQV